MKLIAPIFLASMLSSAGAQEAPAVGSDQPTAPARLRPNVVVVLADDLGIGDISPTSGGCKIKTPNLARMAAGGMTFLDAHSTSAVCTPTRYGLLTGRYNWRSRLSKGVLNGNSGHLIPEERATIGHLMEASGYATAAIGKWHLGLDWSRVGGGAEGAIDYGGPVTNGPDINGFGHYHVLPASLDMAPYVWVDGGKVTGQPDRTEGVTRKDDRYGWYREGPVGADFVIEEALPHIVGEACRFIGERAPAAREGSPFLLYLPLPSPHTPIVPVPPFKGASGMNPYADFVMQVDHHLGELMGALEAGGVADNTLVIFTSDNGCSPEANFPLLGEHGHDPNGGLRGHKADLYEGGHRVPLIVRWPGVVPPGTTSTALACLTDIYATLEDVTGERGRTGGGEDGFSWVPVFGGAPSSGRRTLVSHSVSGHFAVREGDWKLCLAGGSGGWSAPRENVAKKEGLPPLQLFNLASDPAEQVNLVAEQPARVAQLLGRLERVVRRGRSTEGPVISNDREVSFLPPGVELPADD
ncbi:MAG: arylsulfatase [Planctomycetota bacterium]|nr:arylsulfatase [Planctomycetota bacterium]MDG1983747.1 arylsulfatase [Planctomycetota bacterium]